MTNRAGRLVLALAFFVPAIALPADTDAAPPGEISIIDTHVHPSRGGRAGPAVNVPKALQMMDDLRVEKAILLPPPFRPDSRWKYGARELAAIVRGNPGRFAFIAGADSLNWMIHDTPADKVTPALVQRFRDEAASIAASGAVGFGELAAEHFSSGRDSHPYESSPPDHPLFLLLADLSAQLSMPIDLHMEAIPADMDFPRAAQGPNPEKLKENIAAFERLLAHNRNARIVWVHAGWDLTGERTVPLMRRLLGKHPNLFMSIKLDTRGPQRTSAFTPDGAVRPGWMEMLKAFPDRFMVGSDQFADEGPGRLPQARRLVDALPPEVARAVAHENAKRIYRLDAAAR